MADDAVAAQMADAIYWDRSDCVVVWLDRAASPEFLAHCGCHVGVIADAGRLIIAH